MELDDMKAAWQELDRRLDSQVAQNLHLFRRVKLDALRYGLRPLAWGQALLIVAGIMVAIWGGSFWVENRTVPHLLIAGLIVHVAGISMIVSGAVVETFIARVDYSAPVLSIQRQLTQLRKVHVRGGWLAGLPWFVVWVPASMVALKTGFGADLYLGAPGWVWINVAVGLVCLLVSWRLIHWVAKRPLLGQRLEAAAAGGSINRAQARHDEIAAFDKE